MSTHQWIDRICVAVMALALVITGLFMNGESLGIQVVVDEDSEKHSDSTWFTANDLNGSWDSSGATEITLNGNTARISGSGAYVNGSSVYIVQSGLYRLTGTLTDGNVVVDAKSYSKVWVLLDGVDISCAEDACIRVDQADKVFLTLAEGSENTLTGGESYSETALADGTDGVIFAHDDLTINGSGSLTITALCLHGIDAKDDLVITGGTLNVTAPKDGIRGNDSLRITEAEITVNAGDDGFVVNHDDGYLVIASGKMDITSGDDAIHTAGDITIEDGTLTLNAKDDAIHSDTVIRVYGGEITVTDCYEGLEAIMIEQYGGDVTIYARDDGLNANGNKDSEFGAFGGGGGGFDPGQENGGGFGGGHGGMNGNRGNMDGTPPAMPEDIVAEETAAVSAQGDTAETTGNAAEGSEAPEGTPPAMPEDIVSESENESAESEETEETYVLIAGGTLTIINETATDADGIDSNGSLYITGGSVFVSLVNDGANNALDYGSENGGIAEISGGTVIACGSYSMAEGFDSSSTQCSIMYGISAGVDAGTTISLVDSEGNTILTAEIPCSFSCLILSSPEMQLNETYRVIIGDNAEEITLTEVSASYGDAQSSMFGGSMNWGGMQQMMNFSWGQHDSGERPELPDGMTMPEGMTPSEGMAFPEGMTMPDGTPPGGMTAPAGSTDGSFATPPGGMTAPDGSTDGSFATPPGGMTAPDGSTDGSFATPPGGMMPWGEGGQRMDQSETNEEDSDAEEVESTETVSSEISIDTASPEGSAETASMEESADTASPEGSAETASMAGNTFHESERPGNQEDQMNFGGMEGRGAREMNTAEKTSEADDEAAEQAGLSETETWILVGASVLILLIGLLIAGLKKNRHTLL